MGYSMGVGGVVMLFGDMVVGLTNKWYWNWGIKHQNELMLCLKKLFNVILHGERKLDRYRSKRRPCPFLPCASSVSGY